jgi:hypothetical protein
MKRTQTCLLQAHSRQAGKPFVGFEIPLKSQLRCEVKGLPLVL